MKCTMNIVKHVTKIPPHRILAINRGEKEKILSVKITVNEDKIIHYLENKCIKEKWVTDKYIRRKLLKILIRD